MARSCSTICLPVSKGAYLDAVADPRRFRAGLDQAFRDHPELFPTAFADGYRLKDQRRSAKTGLHLRRVRLKATGQPYSIRPSFVFFISVTSAMFTLCMSSLFGKRRLAPGAKAGDGLPNRL